MQTDPRLKAARRITGNPAGQNYHPAIYAASWIFLAQQAGIKINLERIATPAHAIKREAPLAFQHSPISENVRSRIQARALAIREATA